MFKKNKKDSISSGNPRARMYAAFRCGWIQVFSGVPRPLDSVAFSVAPISFIPRAEFSF